MKAKAGAPERKLTRSIARQMSGIMVLLIVLILVGGAILFWLNHETQADLEQEVSQLDTKAFLAGEIQQSMSSLMIEYRGYISYHLPDFKERIEANQRGLVEGVAEFRKVSLTESDREHLRFLEDASVRYSERVADGMRLIEAGEFDEIARRAGEEGFLTFTDELRARHYKFTEEVRLEQMELRAEYARKVDRHTLYYAEYLVLIALVIGLLAVQFARNVGGPLRTLALFSEHYEDVKIINLPYDKRGDEIGYLTRSLKQIFMRIKENERKLIEQNDELQLQQDEMMAQKEQLIFQQDELHHTLVKMQEKEKILAAQHELSVSLLNTLDREELLESIIFNLVGIQQADKGAIVLLQDGFPYASIGVSESGMKQMVKSLDDYMLPRVREEAKAFVIEREAEASDKGYHEHKMKVNDLFLPIRSHSGDLMALIVLTRIGRRFGPDALKQAGALSNQIALSIDKLRTYQATERVRELNQKIIDSIREGVLLFNAKGQLVQVNHMWNEWMGARFQKLDDPRATELFYLQLATRVQQWQELTDFVQGALAGKLAADAQLIYELTGEAKQVIQVYFEKIDGGTILVHRDITREYEVDQMKSEFVSTVSHELRTPLSSVLGFAELMLNKELKPERQRKYLSTIHKEAQRLTQLINDFLDIQRIESGKQAYEMAELDLLSIAREIVELLRNKTNGHTLEIECPWPQVKVRGDANKIRQVLLNLVDNAIKYSPAGGEVRLRFAEENGRFVVEVIDQGLGIPQEALGKLFSKFYRVDNSDRREIGGTGLGLSIAKGIMEAHGGNITVESQLGAGSVFRVQFPSGTRRVSDALEQPGDLNKPRLLVLEDDHALAMLLQEELKESGFEVVQVRDGETALQMVREQSFDALVIDILLEDSLSGWDVIKMLKADPRTADVPVFVSTALEEKERALAMGAVDYLTKPYQPGKLSNVILQTLLRNEKNEA